METKKQAEDTGMIDVITHSSIRVSGKVMIYIDPYNIRDEKHDAGVIFITHEHYDHFSPEDIGKVQKAGTKIVFPETMEDKIKTLGYEKENCIPVSPNQKMSVDGIPFETVPAYNNHKPFHSKKSGWLGYVLTVDGKRIYVAGDTDENADNKNVICDVALVPIGGTYTMNAKEAAEFVNHIRPRAVIPTHYGSAVGKKDDGDKFAGLVDPEIRVELRLFAK